MADKQEILNEIEEHRAIIDELDVQLVKLINDRSRQSLIIRGLKGQAGLDVLDASREDRIYDKVCAMNEGPFTDDNMRELYATLLKIMKEVPVPENL